MMIEYKNNGKRFTYNQVDYKSLRQFYDKNKDSDSCNYVPFTTKIGLGINPLRALKKFKCGEVRAFITERNKKMYKE